MRFKNSKNGFTLIEVLSVIVILGVIMLIAVPAVSKYILKSDKQVYVTNAQAYIETVRAKFEMKEYGTLLQDDEIMLVPLGHIILEKGDSKNSPYGEYDFDRSYVTVAPEKNGYGFYITIIDSSKVGMVNVRETDLNENAVEENISRRIDTISSFGEAASVHYYDGRAYKRSDIIEIEGEDVNSGYNVYVYKDTGVVGELKIIQLFSIGSDTGFLNGMLEHYYDSWRYNGEPITIVPKPTKTGYTFEGYYREMNGNGDLLIDRTGSFVPGIENQLGSYTSVYAYFTANALIFDVSNSSIIFSPNSQTININGALNGTGNYEYQEVSEKDSEGNPTNYMTLSGLTITINGNTPVGTYTYTVKAKDTESKSEKDATFTIMVNKANSSISCINRTYTGSAQTMYTTSNGCTPGTNSTLTNATSSAVTVTCVGDSNYNDSSCMATMNKAESSITCTDRTYNGSAQNMYTNYSGCTPGTNSTLTNATETSVSVTCVGDSNHNDSSCMATMNKAESSITCTNRTYNGSAQNMYTNYSGCTPGTNSSVTNATSSNFTVTCNGDSNHNNSTCTAKMNPQACNAPTNVSISSSGVITWTASSNCSGATHQLSFNNSSFSNASSGGNYRSTLVASTGTKTAYVRAVAPNSNYTTSSSGSGSRAVYSVSLSKGTGVSSVSGAGKYLQGETVTINASMSAHYRWSSWSGTPNTSTQAYSTTINGNWNATANAQYLCSSTTNRPTYGGYKGCSCPAGRNYRDVYNHYYSNIVTSHLCSESTSVNGDSTGCSCGSWHYQDDYTDPWGVCGCGASYCSGNMFCRGKCEWMGHGSSWACTTSGSDYPWGNGDSRGGHCWCFY